MKHVFIALKALIVPVEKMRRKRVFVALTALIVGLFFVGFLLVPPSRVPFTGMRLSYELSGDWSGHMNIRCDTILAGKAQITNATVVSFIAPIRSALEANSTTWVDVESRRTSEGQYISLWIPSDYATIGLIVQVQGITAEISGVADLSVAGQRLDCWIAKAYAGRSSFQYFYEKQTGVLVMLTRTVNSSYYVSRLISSNVTWSYLTYVRSFALNWGWALICLPPVVYLAVRIRRGRKRTTRSQLVVRP